MTDRYSSTQGFDRSRRNALALHQHLRGYPFTARHFVNLDNNLRVYWHTLFDLCPELLKLDPPEGMGVFRGYLHYAVEQRLPIDWSLHLRLYRWLQRSAHAPQLRGEHLESVLSAAASLWCEHDRSHCPGIALTHRDCALRVVGWKPSKTVRQATLDFQVALSVPEQPGDFLWARLPRRGESHVPQWTALSNG
ncbi:MAG: hypothetical protein GAK43_02342 [Stenotrophomonas maltophilia]|nr:MAG: hypothetical protein GAK43_02342 [Stenotrophomonas maltophilia]